GGGGGGRGDRGGWGERGVHNHGVPDRLEANKALVRRLYEEGFNEGRIDVVDELVAPDVVTHDPIILDAPTDPDSIGGGIEMIRKASRTSTSRCSTSSPRTTRSRRSSA